MKKIILFFSMMLVLQGMNAQQLPAFPGAEGWGMNAQGGNESPSAYRDFQFDGNVVEGYPAISADNWKGGVDYEKGTSEARNRRMEPFEFAPVTTQTAEEACELVLQQAGVIAPKRDAQEERIVQQIRTNTFPYGTNGVIDSVEQVGGWPVLKQGVTPVDSDKDGIPDEWEKAHGLNPNDPADANRKDNQGYTFIENYINSLVNVRL
jgi:hypothetical protein